MKIELESTSRLVRLNGVPARIWEGKTASGIPVKAFITRIAIANDPLGNQAEFEKELKECKAPSAESMSFPENMIL